MRLPRRRRWPPVYDRATGTVRVSPDDMGRLLVEFRSAVRRGHHGYLGGWHHMVDFDLSFERLADAVDAARRPGLPPADRMRCEHEDPYVWPSVPKGALEHIVVKRRPDECSLSLVHTAWGLDDEGLYRSLCGLHLGVPEDGQVTKKATTCVVCNREERLSLK